MEYKSIAEVAIAIPPNPSSGDLLLALERAKHIGYMEAYAEIKAYVKSIM